MAQHIYRRSDIQVCQGHVATECAGCQCPDDWCGGHGVVSYCDGTCDGARIAYLQMLEAHRVERPADSTDHITLDLWGPEQQSYRVVFEGPQAQARALAYRAARTSTHHFAEPADAPFSGRAYPELDAALYPLCHHGLSADLCMDPIGDHHYGTREWEMAHYGE